MLDDHVSIFSTLHLEPQVFACVAYVHLHKNQRSKLDPCAVRCVFIDFSPQEKGYRCYHPSTRHVYITMDVTFFQDELPPQPYSSRGDDWRWRLWICGCRPCYPNSTDGPSAHDSINDPNGRDCAEKGLVGLDGPSKQDSAEEYLYGLDMYVAESPSRHDSIEITIYEGSSGLSDQTEIKTVRGIVDVAWQEGVGGVNSRGLNGVDSSEHNNSSPLCHILVLTPP